jgi:MFS family permease
MDATAPAKELVREARATPQHTATAGPGEMAIGVIIGRTSEFFDFFVYAIASVLVAPKIVFPYLDPLQATLWSFAIFALAFVARPLGTAIFMTIDRRYGRGAKMIIALFLLGGSTASIAFLPGYDTVGVASAYLLALSRTAAPGTASPRCSRSTRRRRGAAGTPWFRSSARRSASSSPAACSRSSCPSCRRPTSSIGAGAIRSSSPSRSMSWRCSRACASW